MSTSRFEFTHGGERFEVTGEFGSWDKKFFVTRFLPGARRFVGVPSGPPSGARIEKLIEAADRDDLHTQLKAAFPGLSDFGAA
jgi:hypothetical protein